MKTKQIIRDLVVLPLLLVLASCDGATSDSTTNESGGSDTSIISYSDPEPNDPHWVHFVTNCEATLDPIFIARIEAMPLVQNGTKTLEGWFLEETFANIVSFPYRVLQDVTMYAKWTEGNPQEFTFASTVNNSGYIVTSYGGNATNVVIPSYYNSKPVVELGEYLFYNNGAIVSVVMPNSLTKIGMAAFKNCVQLADALIPDTVTILETDAFAGCLALVNIDMPAMLVSIGNNAFEDTAIATIEIHYQVNEINSRAFADCDNLRSVYFDSLTPPLRFANSFENTSAELRYKVYASALSAYTSSAYWSAFADQIIAR